MKNFEKLNNPVFNALSETQQDFCINIGNLKAYQPETNPFGGFSDIENSAAELEEYSKICNAFFIFGSKPNFSENIQLKAEITCNQMICKKKADYPIKEEIIHLNNQFEDELYNLVQEFYPGFFRKKTSVLGNYYGIFKNQQLVAVVGERFQMSDFCEVSAVVTHKNYEGFGYAKQLVCYVTNRILANGKIPFLHVDERNEKAISVYEKSGFTLRDKIKIWYFSGK